MKVHVQKLPNYIVNSESNDNRYSLCIFPGVSSQSVISPLFRPLKKQDWMPSLKNLSILRESKKTVQSFHNETPKWSKLGDSVPLNMNLYTVLKNQGQVIGLLLSLIILITAKFYDDYSFDLI